MTRLAFIASLLLFSRALCPLSNNRTRSNRTSSKASKINRKASSRTAEKEQQTGQSQQSSDAPPAPEESSSKKSRGDDDNGGKGATPDAPPAISSDAEKAKAAATYNPLPAQQDVEVGMYYLHKGDIDAAIDRFLDAIQQRPNFAKPRLLLGKAYEKKHDNESAVKYYKEYLKVLPGAPDAKEVQKKIEKLSKE